MILAIVQARTTSSRFPAKVLQPILGEPMILRQIERIKPSSRINKIIVATSTDATDNELAGLCKQNNIECFRGDLNDVLDRYYQAAKLYTPLHIVRLTGDCPLLNAEVIDEVISFHLEGNFDYTSNIIEPTYPDGLDTEILKFSVLEKAWSKAVLPSHREHVTRFIYTQPNSFKLGNFKFHENFSHLRWTVDERIDFDLITVIFEALYFKNPYFGMDEILQYLNENPKLKEINLYHKRNEGLQKSLFGDEIFRARLNAN